MANHNPKHHGYDLYSLRDEQTCNKIAASRKGQPGNNKGGIRHGNVMIPKARIRTAVRRVLKRMCSRCPHKIAAQQAAALRDSKGS